MSSESPSTEAQNARDSSFNNDRATVAAVWRLPPKAKFLWRTWDDETVIFNSLSGQTHLLDALSAETLKEIERAPGTISQLACRLADAFHVPVEDLVPKLPEIVTRFDSLGLAEPDR